MLDSVHSNHLIQSLAGIVRRIQECITAIPDEALDWQPDEGQWSVQMVLTHLLNCEAFMRERLERIVNEEYPTVEGFGPDEAIPYSNKSVSRLLDEFDEARKQTLVQVYTYSVADWDRQAIHSVMGETTLKEQIQLIVKHDTEHLGQIYDLRELWKTQNSHEEISPERKGIE